jgi:hypothetical protein
VISDESITTYDCRLRWRKKTKSPRPPMMTAQEAPTAIPTMSAVDSEPDAAVGG